MMYKSLTTILSEPVHASCKIPGFITGYPSLDAIMGGISESELVLVVAKVGNWSSILMLNLAVGLSSRYHVLFINTAKGAPAVARELKSVLLPGTEPKESDEEALNELNRLATNIFIEDEAHFLEDIEQSIARFRSDYPSDAIVLIDDLNNIFLSNEIVTYPRSQAEGEIAANLKMLTLKYNMPVLLLTKIESPEPHKKNDPPVLSDVDYLKGLAIPFNKIISVHLSEFQRNETDKMGEFNGNKLFLKILRSNNGTCWGIRLTMSESNRFRLIDETQSQVE